MIRERLAAQLLAGPPAGSPEQVVRRLLAVQAQDPRGARLAVRVRSHGLTAADVDEALSTRRSAVVTWLNRGTLHLVDGRDYWWLHPLTTPQLGAGSARRLQQEGVDPGQAARGVEVVTEAVADGPRTRGQLRGLLDAAGVPTGGQALVHVLLAASIRSDVVRGPVVGSEQAFVSARTWLGPPPEPLPPDEGLARLARRYLEGHGPAGPADLARWAGVTLGAARRGLAAIAEQTRPYDGDPVDLVDLVDREPPSGRAPLPCPRPRLLGPFDPLLLGWTSREDVVGPYTQVVTSNGVFRPVALVDGRVVATWRLVSGEVVLEPLEPVAEADRQALQADGRDVQRFLGLPVSDPG